LRALLAGDWRVTGRALSKLRAVYGKWPTGRRAGRSQHYCGSLDCGCGLPLVAFWQQKANAKC